MRLALGDYGYGFLEKKQTKRMATKHIGWRVKMVAVRHTPKPGIKLSKCGSHSKAQTDVLHCFYAQTEMLVGTYGWLRGWAQNLRFIPTLPCTFDKTNLSTARRGRRWCFKFAAVSSCPMER